MFLYNILFVSIVCPLFVCCVVLEVTSTTESAAFDQTKSQTLFSPQTYPYETPWRSFMPPPFPPPSHFRNKCENGACSSSTSGHLQSNTPTNAYNSIQSYGLNGYYHYPGTANSHPIYAPSYYNNYKPSPNQRHSVSPLKSFLAGFALVKATAFLGNPIPLLNFPLQITLG